MEVAEGLWWRLFCPGTDLFASSELYCAKDYISCVPDLQACRVDVFVASSWPEHSYAFPPVPLISKCLVKLKQLNITAIVVTPVWRMAAWWDQLQELNVQSIYLGKTKEVCKTRKGPMLPKLGLLMATVVQGGKSSHYLSLQ